MAELFTGRTMAKLLISLWEQTSDRHFYIINLFGWFGKGYYAE